MYHIFGESFHDFVDSDSYEELLVGIKAHIKHYFKMSDKFNNSVSVFI